MDKEETIKILEEEQLNRLLTDLKDIDKYNGFKDGAFKYYLGKYQGNLLVNKIELLVKENKQLKDTIDKAIEYINSDEISIDIRKNDGSLDFVDTKDLLSILGDTNA